MPKKKILTWLAALLPLAALLIFICLPPIRARFLGIAMLFTQGSVQTLQGAIRSAASPGLFSVFLSAFHTACLPWLPPRQFLASAACLGSIYGGILSLLGVLLGSSLWYWLLRLLLSPLWNRRKTAAAGPFPSALLLGGILLFQGMSGPLLALAGGLKLPYGRSLLGTALGAGTLIGLYSYFCGPYSSYLPSAWARGLRIAGILHLLFCLWSIWKKASARQKRE